MAGKSPRDYMELPEKLLGNPGGEISYIRYADDWMIGVKGPSTLAKQLKEENETEKQSVSSLNRQNTGRFQQHRNVRKFRGTSLH